LNVREHVGVCAELVHRRTDRRTDTSTIAQRTS
jgi:hypothetical protein